MKELTFIKDDDVFTNSLVIAQYSENEHESVVALIKKYEEDFLESGVIEFTDLKSGKRGRPIRVYELNEEQALLLVTYLDNTVPVRQFKKNLVRAFVQMRKLLLEKQTQDWQETRQLSKIVRLQATDIIKELVDYAITQGSQNADMLYMVYSKLVKSMAGYQNRDCSRVEVLTKVIWFEQVIRTVIKEEMLKQSYYKDIYQRAKKEIAELIKYWSMPQLTA